MDQKKIGFPMLQGVKLSQTQCPTTAEDREKTKGVPYVSAIGSIMYAMLCTRPDVCLTISLAGGYQSNLGSGSPDIGQEHPEIPEKDEGYVSRLWR